MTAHRFRPVVPLVLALAACNKPESATSTASASANLTASATPTPTPTPAQAQAQAQPQAQPQAPTPPDAIIAQHVLVAYKGAKRAPKGVARSKREARERAHEALAKIRAGTPFEDVVTAYSDDTGSAERMGSVGKFHREDMDPAFSTAAFALKVGEVSDVVETPFGFHVIKRTQ